MPNKNPHKTPNEFMLLPSATLKPVAADFAMTEGAESEKRYYREAQPAQAMEENDQYVLFTVPGLESLAMYYEAGQPLMVNHEKWGSIGYGQTVAASVADKVLTVQFYILRDFEPGTGPVHASNELIKAVEDGFLKDVSVGVKIMRSECSICGNDYGNYRECRHWRGQREVVTDQRPARKQLSGASRLFTRQRQPIVIGVERQRSACDGIR